MMKDGRLGKCKDCCKAHAKENRIGNISLRIYERSRSKLPHRKEAAKKYVENNRALVNENSKRWAQRNKEKRKAYWKVQEAIERGDLVRQTCEVCGEIKTEAHHEDYSKPLEVRWLCTKHHGKTRIR